jgi:hypothetical protein
MDAVREKSKGDAHAHKKRRDKDEKKDHSSSERENKEGEYIYSTTSHQPDRTLFVVDLSRLKAERDTLENALVLYRPEADIKKVWMTNLSCRKRATLVHSGQHCTHTHIIFSLWITMQGRIIRLSNQIGQCRFLII